MSQIKNIVITFLVVVIMGLIAGGIVWYYSMQTKQISGTFSREKAAYEKKLQDAEKETLAIKGNFDKIQDNYMKLEQVNKNLIVERDSLSRQIRGVEDSKKRAEELSNTVEDQKKTMKALEGEKGVLQGKNVLLARQLRQIAAFQRQLVRKRDLLAHDVAALQDKTNIKKTEDENGALKKQNSEMQALVKKQDSEMQSQVKRQGSEMQAQVKKLESEVSRRKDHEVQLTEQVTQLTDQVVKFNKAYTEAVRKNKSFERKVTEAPAKFAELARQNKALIRQTSTMHYNLGVFYTQHKEYSRAADEFENAVGLTPDDAYSHFNLGYIYAEYLVNRPKAIWHFQNYLRVAKKDDKDVDWVKKYILTWQTYQGKEPMQ